jgi:uncharacterized membrane protein
LCRFALQGFAMSGRRFHGPSFLRTLLAVVVIADLLSFYFFLGDARAAAVAGGTTLSGFNDVFSRTAVRGTVVLIGIAAAVAFAGRPGRLWQGMVALAALALLSTAHAQLFGSPWRHLFFSGLCLLGWLLGLAFSRRHEAPSDESYARTGSIALLGAAYLSSGISKIVYGGPEWLSGLPVQVAIIGQDGLVSDSLFSPYRSWVVATPVAASLLSVATVALELAGPLMLAGRRTRACVALGLFAMHANIYLLTTYILYWESMVLLAAFGLSSDEPSAEPESGTPASVRLQGPAFAAAVALLTLSTLLAIGHQARRHARSAAGPEALPSPPPAPAIAPLQQVGPFAVGQTLAESWTVASLDWSDGGFVIALSGKPGLARFGLSCAPSEHRGPFDLGAARIFYFHDLEFRELEAVGWAVREEVRRATEGRDVCATLASWRSSAQAGERR